jgi:hypothetical protein
VEAAEQLVITQQPVMGVLVVLADTYQPVVGMVQIEIIATVADMAVIVLQDIIMLYKAARDAGM